MNTKPTKPSCPGDMRKTSNRKQYSTVENRDKVVPRVLPHPESMKLKEPSEGK
jgi:hypothetical protein